MIKKLLGIVVLGLLLSGKAYAENLQWNIETSIGTRFIVLIFPINQQCIIQDQLGICEYTKKGNTYYINLNNSHFIMEGSKSFFSNKISGKWKSKNKNNPDGDFWGTQENL